MFPVLRPPIAHTNHTTAALAAFTLQLARCRNVVSSSHHPPAAGCRGSTPRCILRFLACDHSTTHQPHHRCARLTPAGKPRNRRAPLTLQLSDFPTHRQVGKPTSRKVGTHQQGSAPPPFTPHPTAQAHPHARLLIPPHARRPFLLSLPPPVTVIAQCSHSTLQSLHNAITPHLHPAAAHHRTLYPLRSPPPNPAHSVITPPRIPSCALAVLPRGKRKPSTVHTSSHRCATSFSALDAAPPMPYRSQFITATDDPLLHPPTRNAAKPPPTPCNTASCPATTQRHTNHTTARARHTPPVNQKPRSRSCPSCAHPPDLLPHRSHFITPPFSLPAG